MTTSAVEGWASAAATVTPFLQGWLGQAPRSQLTILDLPDPRDAPFETGPLLATAIRQATPDQLTASSLTRSRTRGCAVAPRMAQRGRRALHGNALARKAVGPPEGARSLESGRTALALIEPSSPGESPGQPLAQAISPVYYRTKATYVFWMLRELAGDPALSAALRAYDPPRTPRTDWARLPAPALRKALEQAGLRRDLSWFFADWVDADKGLPDIAIDNVFPTSVDRASLPLRRTPSDSGAGPGGRRMARHRRSRELRLRRRRSSRYRAQLR
jgi:hypothetical protein